MKKLFLFFFLISTHVIYCQTLDNTFSGDGVFTFDMGGGDCAQEMVIGPDGSIYICGYGGATGNYGFAIAKIRPDGTFDNTFSIDGKLILTGFPNESLATSYTLSLDAAGNIYVAGAAANSASIVKVKPDGTIDTSFDSDGIVVFSTTNIDYFSSMTLDNLGNIYLAGTLFSNESMIVKIKSDGTFDNSFDGDGNVIIEFNSYPHYNREIRVDSFGNIYLGIWYITSGSLTSNGAVIKLNSDGSYNTNFDGDGIFIINDIDLNFMGLDISENIIIGSHTSNSVKVTRLKSDGSFDLTFDTDGQVEISVNETFKLNDGIIDNDGNIFFGGSVNRPTTYYNDFAIMKINSDGTADNLFGSSGIFSAQVYNFYNNGNAIAANSEGDLFLAGCIGNDFFSGDIAVLKVGESTFTDIRNDNIVTQKVNIYPIPAKESITIETEYEINKITLIDSKGIREIHYDKRILTNLKGLLMAEIDLEGTNILYKKIMVE